MARSKPVPFTNFPFPMVGGLDTKISGVTLPAPKLQLCQNAYSDKSGSLKKRAGMLALTSSTMSGGTIGTPIALATYKDNQISFSNNQANEYSSVAGRWVDTSVLAYSPRVRVDNVVNRTAMVAASGSVDMATAGSVTAVANMTFQASGANTINSVFVTVFDADGTVLKNALQLYTTTGATETTAVRCIALGTRIYVFFYDTTVTKLKVWILDTTSATTMDSSFSSSAVEVTPADINTTVPIYDVAVGTASTAVWLVYRTTAANQLKLGFVDTAGALNNTTTHATVAAPLGVANAVNASTGHGFVYSAGTTPSDIYVALKTFSGGVWTNVQTSAAIENGTLGAAITPICLGCYYDSTTFRFWYSGDGAAANAKTYESTYTTSGTSSPRIRTLRHSFLASKPFKGPDSTFYFWSFAGAQLTNVQPTLFLMKNTTTPVAWANQDEAYFPVLGWLPQVQSSGTSTFTIATPYLAEVDPQGSFLGPGTRIGTRTVAVDMLHAQSHKSTEMGESLYMAGGFLQQYDGAGFVESGFLRIASTSGTTGEAITAASSNTASGALTPSAQYSYIVVPEWTNIRGEREQGTHNGALSITLGGADDTVTLTIPCTPYTLKKASGNRTNFVWAVYRTEENPTSDAEFHRVGVIENDATADSVSFVDITGTVSQNEELYLDSGELENIAPPAGYILAQGGGRLWLAGLSNDKYQIRASKIREAGRPVFFNDTLIVQVPEAGGAITALEYLNEQLVIFTEKKVYILPRGGGPGGETGMNNLGVGAFITPELVQGADTGCTGQRSVCSSPMGLFFQGTKGIELLDPGLQCHYIGAQLEGLTVGTITGAVLMPSFQQVRFSSSSAMYVFDYFHKIWSTYTCVAEAMTLAQGGKCVILGSGSTAGILMIEDAATFTDNGTAFLMKVRLAWVASQEARQGSLRFRWVGHLATPAATATVRTQISVNYLSTVSQTIDTTYVSGELNLPTRRQFRLNASSQIASSMQVELDDQSAANASVTFHQIDFNMGLRDHQLGRLAD